MLEHNQVPRRFCNFQYVWPHFFLEHFQLLIFPCIQNVKAKCFQPARRHSILCWASHHESTYFQEKTCSEADFFAFCLVSRVSGGARAFSAIQKSTWNDNKFQNLRRVSLKSQEVQREWGVSGFFPPKTWISCKQQCNVAESQHGMTKTRSASKSEEGVTQEVQLRKAWRSCGQLQQCY